MQAGCRGQSHLHRFQSAVGCQSCGGSQQAQRLDDYARAVRPAERLGRNRPDAALVATLHRIGSPPLIETGVGATAHGILLACALRAIAAVIDAWVRPEAPRSSRGLA